MATAKLVTKHRRVVTRETIDRRHAGCGAVVGDKLYLWGGQTEDPVELPSDDDDSDDDSDEEDTLPIPTVAVNLPRPTDDDHPFDVFDLKDFTWSKEVTYGKLVEEVPSVGIGSTLSYHSGTHSLYLYGGWNERQFTSDMYVVSMETWNWEKIPVEDIKPTPRYLTGVLVHGDRLCNFAGVSLEIGDSPDKGAVYKSYIDEHHRINPYGWNNEYFEFNIVTRNWDVPMSGRGGVRPPPVGGHVFTKFDRHRAVYFGGKGENGMTDALYIFDLDTREFEGPLTVAVSPVHRRFMTLSPLLDPELVEESLCYEGGGGEPVEQRLLLLWGKESHNVLAEDAWLLNTKDMKWTKLEVDEEGRYWHVACPYYSEPGKESQVIIYGGAKRVKSRAIEFNAVRDLTIFSFGVKSLQNLCVSVITAILLQNETADLDQFCSRHLSSRLECLVRDSVKRNLTTSTL